MAKIQIIDEWEMINVTASVGRGCVNMKDDVIVVQALLNYVLENNKNFHGSLLPVTGVLNRKTARRIKEFQEMINRTSGKHYQVSADGRINPAKNDGVPGKRLHWTISVMNDEAVTRHANEKKTSGDYIQELYRRFPPVATVLKNGIGSLGLSLESSGVGSLDLGLE